MSKAPRPPNGGSPIDASVRRAVAKIVDTALRAVVKGAHTKILARFKATSHEDLRARLTDAASGLVLDSCDGAEFADAIIDDVIETLRRALPGQTRQSLELLLADARTDAVSGLGEFTDGLIDCNQFIDEAVDNLSDGAP